MPVGPVRLGAIADIRREREEPSSIARLNGKPAAIVIVFRDDEAQLPDGEASDDDPTDHHHDCPVNHRLLAHDHHHGAGDDRRRQLAGADQRRVDNGLCGTPLDAA